MTLASEWAARQPANFRQRLPPPWAPLDKLLYARVLPLGSGRPLQNLCNTALSSVDTV